MKERKMKTKNGTPIRYAGARELRWYANYWFIRLTPKELQSWPGTHWSGYVIIHKYKWWQKYNEYFPREEGIYHYLDGDRNNIRITNIGVRANGRDEWL